MITLLSDHNQDYDFKKWHKLKHLSHDHDLQLAGTSWDALEQPELACPPRVTVRQPERWL